MSEDRTTPMRHGQWSQQGSDLDDQETMYANQEGATPPTLPLGDEGGWGQQVDPGFGPAIPPEGAVPQKFQPQGRTPPPAYPDAGTPQDQTMLISERPTPVFAWLVVVDGPDRMSIGTVHVLHADTTTLGRVHGNHIVLRDETCSAQHARIRIVAQEDQEPTYVVFDMGSRNGTYIGDKGSYKDEENRQYRYELQDGNYLLLGETTLVFKKL